MKKIILAAALAVSSITLSAQNMGDMAVGGIIGISGGSSTTATSLNGNTNSEKAASPMTLEFSPEFSYFVIDNLELSAGLNYGMSREPIISTGDATLFGTTNIAKFTIGANWFFPMIDGVLYYTPGVKFGFGGGSYVAQTGSSSKSTTKLPFAFSFDAELGTIEFMPAGFLGISLNLLDFNVSYITRNTGSDNVKMSSTTFTAALNYGISAGVKYYF